MQILFLMLQKALIANTQPIGFPQEEQEAVEVARGFSNI